MTNITDTFMTTPYNLSALQNITGIPEYYGIVNNLMNGLPAIGILIIVAVVTYALAQKQDYDQPSSIAFSAGFCFILSLAGRVTIIGGVPLVATHILVFFGVALAASLAWIKFTPRF